MNHEWLHIKTISEPELSERNWRWRKLAVRDDGYFFYGRSDTEEGAMAELDRHIDDSDPPFPPLTFQEIVSFRRSTS